MEQISALLQQAQETIADLSVKQNKCKEMEVLMNEREKLVAERELRVVDSENYQAAQILKIKGMINDVENKKRDNEQVARSLERKESALREREARCAEREAVCEEREKIVAQRSALIKDRFEAVQNNYLDKMSELSPQIKIAEKKYELMRDHYAGLERLMSEKSREIDEMKSELGKVKMLTAMKSEAYRISAEVKELVLTAQTEADVTLESIEARKQIKALQDLTNDIAEFAEKQEKRRIQLDCIEGRLVCLNDVNVKQLKIIDEQSRKLEEQKKELEKTSQEVKKSMDKLENANILLRLGVQQYNKDKQNWKQLVEEEVMAKQEKQFGNLLTNLKALTDAVRGIPSKSSCSPTKFAS